MQTDTTSSPSAIQWSVRGLAGAISIWWHSIRRRVPVIYILKFCFLTSSAMYSEVRQPRAEMVRVGFLSALLTKGAPSVMKRFFTSHAWQYWFSTDVLGLLPILVAPTSCFT